MEKFLKMLVLAAIIFTANASVFGNLHKVRHKHNVFHFNDRHVNEVREAFDEYKNTIQKPKSDRVNFDDAVRLKSLRHHRRNEVKLSDEMTESASENRFVNDEASKSETTRIKRVQESTTRKIPENSSDNYDEEYDDDDDGDTKKVSDGSVMKVQVSCPTTRPIIWPHKLFSNESPR